jgi:hypothetical protein
MSKITGLRWRAGIMAPLLIGAFLIAPAKSHDGTPQLARLGQVEFKVECNAAAQQEFNRAMALYHSFAWKEATASFDAVSKTDPSCGMAHWGRAMTMLDNPFVWPVNLPPKTLNDALAALEAARAAGLRSQRERDYVEALAVFLRDHDKLNHRDRLQSLEAAMATLAASYPNDTEASILSALVTSANFNPADKTYANQYKAAKILDPLFAVQPDHPGVAHYLIHSYDYPPIAKHGLDAAKRYAKIAPDAPHALHMPSHIFTRLGYWQESIEANRASAKTASSDTYYPHHAYDYMVYAHLQLAQDRAARQATEQSLATKAIDNNAAAFAYAAMPARLALELGEWQEAGKLALHPGADAYPWKKYPHAEAINAFARGVGLARSGDSSAAMAQHARLITLRNAAKEAKLPYWADQIDIQSEVVRGLSLVADGKTAEGVAILNDAAQREDATEKHVVTPGPLLPAREVLAEVFLEAGNSDAALIEYEAVLAKEPNRYRATFGAARAAHLSGDAEKARVHFTQLVELAQSADTERDSLQEARRFLAQK